MDAQHLTCKVIDYLISLEDKNLNFVACEVKILNFTRRIDVLLSKGKSLISIEIKSDRDSLRRLDGQIIDMNKVSHRTYVACTNRHLKEAKKICPQNIGQILINEGGVKLIKEARPRKKLNKKSIIECFQVEEMKIHFDTGKNYLNRYQIINKIMSTYSLEEITDIYIDMMNQKYKPRFEEFMKNRGAITIIDDLQILTRRTTGSLNLTY